MRFIVLASLLMAGCGQTYVPVEFEKPVAPAECKKRDDIVQKMQSFKSSDRLTVLDVNAAWAKHEIESRSVARRNARRHEVCGVFVRQVSKD